MVDELSPQLFLIFTINMQEEFLMYLSKSIQLCYNINRNESSSNALASNRNSFGISLLLYLLSNATHIPSVDLTRSQAYDNGALPLHAETAPHE
jgi:hypothetical protein